MPGPGSSAENAYRYVIDEVTDYAIFLLDAEGRIETWTRGGEVVFGYRAEEIVGRHFGALFLEEDRRNGVPEKELDLARRNGRSEDTRWHVRGDGRTFFADGVTTAIFDESGGLTGFAKIARDITDRFRTEQRLAAQLALTSLLNQDRPSDLVAREVMHTVCENLGWDVGAMWEVDPARTRIACVDYWHADHVDPDVARELSMNRAFRRGDGLPGRVWESGGAIWITDFSDERAFPRAPIARRANLRAAFAFPIVHEAETSGVMEFFSTRDREPDQQLIPVMTLIGAQIGDYIEGRRKTQALRESEERYRLITETAQDAIFTIDEASRIYFCNAAVKQLFGWEPSELIGGTLDAIIPERLRDAHHRGIARYVRTGQRKLSWGAVELPALHRDGHEFPAEMSFGAWRGPDGTRFTGYVRDITERKRVAADLQRSLEEAQAAREQLQRRAEEEAAFRHLASALTGAVEMTEVLYEITNRATQVTRADGVYVERIVDSQGLVEVVASAGRGTPPRGLRVSFPGSMTKEIMQNRQPVILTDMSSFGEAMAPYLVDTCSNCQVLVTPIVAEDEPLGALVLLNSRSSGRELRQSDVIRARTLGDLASLALRRVRLLEFEREAKKKAEAAVRVRDETLGIVSHDLRNPLTKIALSADLLLDARADEQRELISTIQTSARQMERLIQDLLDVARLESGRFAVDRHMIDPVPLVTQACDSNRPIAERKSQRIHCHIEGTLPEICADRDRLMQVFGNLIGNAMKFAPERGSITVEAKAVAGGVQFRVSDTGPGVPEADLNELFRPYYQAKKTAHMGAGLGLAIVRGIVEAHGGVVSAANAPGGGAVFTFMIPSGSAPVNR
ncbi:MAG TPA: PAS domain S-box protein [Thermoanaerobaculia bacterium]|nr:PAS domain S-box protein [Thermoanaerobaculia bacterium]